MPEPITLDALPNIDDDRPPSVADQIHDVLYERVVDLSLPPGAKLSEAEVAAQMGVSRQPVRDAFYRLSKQGFIQIRPQRATLVTPISEASVMQAQFVRSALECQVVRVAALTLDRAALDGLARLIDEQADSVEAGRLADFHRQDDRFHHDICAGAGLGFVWSLVKENKGHMDRARFLSLTSGAPVALQEHRSILAALREGDAEAAVAAMAAHLDRIRLILPRLHEGRPEMFPPED